MKSSSRKIFIGLISLAFILTIPLVFFPPRALADYAFTTIDPGNQYQTYAYGINNAGQIVGEYGSLGFLYSGNSFTSIVYPTASHETGASGINNVGQIVGYYDWGYPGQASFLYSGGSFTSFVYPTASGDTYARGINDTGQIVGSYIDTKGQYRGFLYSGNSFTSIDYPGATQTLVFAINNAGQIVGYYIGSDGIHRRFVYSGGSFTSIIDYPTPSGYTTAFGINNHGQIVGSYIDTKGQYRGFLCSGGLFMSIDYPGASHTWPYGINDRGQISGYFAGTGVHGFLATPPPVRELVTVKIDIDPDRINLKSKGKIEVAILSTKDFDGPHMVDIDSLTFGRSGNEDSLAFCKSKPKDFDRDGLKDDLVCHFYIQDAGFQCHDAEGILNGKTKDGTAIQGSDSVNIVPCK